MHTQQQKIELKKYPTWILENHLMFFFILFSEHSGIAINILTSKGVKLVLQKNGLV